MPPSGGWTKATELPRAGLQFGYPGPRTRSYQRGRQLFVTGEQQPERHQAGRDQQDGPKINISGII